MVVATTMVAALRVFSDIAGPVDTVAPQSGRATALRPTGVSAQYQWRVSGPLPAIDDGSIELRFVTVSGPVVRKDGSEGASRASRVWQPGHDLHDAPAWVRDWTDQATATLTAGLRQALG